MKKQKEQSKILQLKIKLDGIKPLIWRRVLVNSNITFEDLHLIIQNCMGWENSHLYCFQFGNRRRDGITIQCTKDPLGYSLDKTFIDTDYEAEELVISNFLNNPKDKCSYEYDFGDSWMHTITVEKVLEPNQVKLPVPQCLAGAMKCPLEDCGGVWGYYNLQEALEDVNHEDHEAMLEWVGEEEIDWNEFSVEEVNARL